MASLWPWLVVAATGALHGLNPASGWLLAAAPGVRSRDRAQVLRSLVPIAFGHAASVGAVAAAIAFGVAMDRVLLRDVAIGLLVAAALLHLSRRTPAAARAPARHAALAVWSFVVSTVHGSGLTLVPMLMPLCAGAAPAGAGAATAPLTLAIAAVGVHAGGMLAMAAVVAATATGAWRAFDAGARWTP